MDGDAETHEGGCHCGAIRYRTTGMPAKTAVCHCRDCQLRTGSAFGVSVYFDSDRIEILQGVPRGYHFQSESGRSFATQFCPECGTTLMWVLELFPGRTGVAGGTFDPPSFWYDVGREVFTRSRAPFAVLGLPDSSETSSSYAPCAAETP
ncbi:GFA family protein [Psychromarinibacter sp. S121]|uniref:GFA family protein n=1 Tax=Psychromarinibacter sp. S121 TaxID=3415127 RepID=UPI003C7AEA3C